MSYSIKDLKNLVDSDEFKTFQESDNRNIRLGEKIYGRRKDLSLTQSELSEKTWIPQNKISQLESGTYGEPGRDILERLSEALKIDINYFILDEIERKTFELYNYILPRIKLWDLSKFQLIKIPYFIDLEVFELLKYKLSNYNYIRLNYWPFDKKLYSYMQLFDGLDHWYEDFKNLSLGTEEIEVIDKVINSYPVNDGEALKKLSYETYPMKNLWATIWWREWWREELVF